jgi:transcriptional regulator with XRE-family HTH domain
VFRQLITQSRLNLSITQATLAKQLNKPQSYVSKYESGERRLDIIEFLEILEALKIDPCKFIKKLERDS